VTNAHHNTQVGLIHKITRIKTNQLWVTNVYNWSGPAIGPTVEKWPPCTPTNWINNLYSTGFYLYATSSAKRRQQRQSDRGSSRSSRSTKSAGKQNVQLVGLNVRTPPPIAEPRRDVRLFYCSAPSRHHRRRQSCRCQGCVVQPATCMRIDNCTTGNVLPSGAGS